MPEKSATPNRVELARKTIEAGNRRDPDVMASPYAPDAVWDMSALGLGTFNGRAATRDHFEDWLAPHEELDYMVEQIRDVKVSCFP
jgi:ketosteroid isomerase-like protein